MADSAPDGGEAAFAYFITPQIGQVTETLITVMDRAGSKGMVTLQRASLTLLNQMLSDVNVLAARMAGTADGAILTRLIATQARNRPWGGAMEMHVLSQPGPLGLVRVALIKELDKIVNPNGEWGPYWRAQEYGTGSDEGGYGGGGIPRQAGRRIYGVFEPSGTPPDADQAGLGKGHDLAFVSGGQNPGVGVINVELPARHFLRDGSREAGAAYIRAINGLQDKWAPEIEALIKLASRPRPGRGGPRVHRWIITDR